MNADNTARSMRDAPFVLLAWVLSALGPTDLLGPACRALVMRALVDVSIACRAARGTKIPAEHRGVLVGIADRAKAGIEALGEDARALTEDALPPPVTLVDGRAVARVLFAVLSDVARGDEYRAHLPPMLDVAWCERIAVRASAHDVDDSITAARQGPKKPPA